MKGKLSYHAERVEGSEDFKTVGVLVLVGNDLAYVPVVPENAAVNPPQERMVNEIFDALARGLKAEDIFDYYIERSNGVMESFSLGQDISGQSLDEIKRKALESIRH